MIAIVRCYKWQTWIPDLDLTAEDKEVIEGGSWFTD